MKLHDLKAGSEISITSIKDSMTAKFFSEILQVKEESDLVMIRELAQDRSWTLIKLIETDDKVINFEIDGITHRIIGTLEGQSYYWSSSSIILVNTAEFGRAHLIISQQEGIRFNRRESFRLWIGIDGTITFGEHKACHDVVIKDISTTGVGIFIKAQHNLSIGDTIKVQFKDEYIPDGGDEYVTTLYSVIAEVVRVMPRDENTNLVGCTIKSNTTEIERFISKKQLQRLKVGGRRQLFGHKNDTELLEEFKKLKTE